MPLLYNFDIERPEELFAIFVIHLLNIKEPYLFCPIFTDSES